MFLRFCGSGISSFLYFHLISILVLALTAFMYTSTVCSADPTTIITRADTVEVTVDDNSIAKNAVTGLGNSDVAIQEGVTGDGGVVFYISLTPTVAALLADIALYTSGAKISNAMLIDFTQGVHGASADCSTVTGNNEVDLTWTALSNNITEYEVLYGTVYHFRVVAKNVVGTGPVSNVISATINVPGINNAPVLATISPIIVNEGVTKTLHPTFTDIDGDQLSLSYSDCMTSNSYTINYTDAGTHTVMVTVSDGILIQS